MANVIRFYENRIPHFIGFVKYLHNEKTKNNDEYAAAVICLSLGLDMKNGICYNRTKRRQKKEKDGTV